MDAQLGNVTNLCGGQSFRSIEDCDTFIVQHVPGNTYAYFYDMVSLLQRGWGENHISMTSVWDTTYHMKKAGFTCMGEAVIFASMSTILPTCLGELTGKTVESTHPRNTWTLDLEGEFAGATSQYQSWSGECERNAGNSAEAPFCRGSGGGNRGKGIDVAFPRTQFQTMLDDFFLGILDLRFWGRGMAPHRHDWQDRVRGLASGPVHCCGFE
jgi:hypothetical protein